MSAQGRAPLVIERLTVRADRVVCDVILAPGVPRVDLAEVLRQDAPEQLEAGYAGHDRPAGYPADLAPSRATVIIWVKAV